MLKNDTKDQFPLFDLPSPAGAAAQPAPAEAKQQSAPEERAVLPGRTKMKKVAPSPAARRTRETDAKPAPKGGRSAKSSPGPVPDGDVRLTANIREDLHLKLKIVAATRRTTIGELIEDLVEHHL